MGFLDKITVGVQKFPLLVCIYGPDGVGKTTFGFDAPSPIFLGTEAGTKTLPAKRLPEPEGFGQVLAQVGELTTAKHDFRTLVIDSLDWLEPLVFKHVCDQHNANSIETVLGGYGKGYVESLNQWHRLRVALAELQAKRGMNVVLIAHSMIKAFRDPETGLDYDRYQIKLNDKAAALWREYVDAVLFAKFDVAVTKASGDKKAKAFGDGARVMFTQSRPAFDAKNRFGLDFRMDLSWEAFEKAVRRVDTRDAGQIAKSCIELLEKVSEKEVQDKAAQHLHDCGSNIRKLKAAENRLKELVG